MKPTPPPGRKVRKRSVARTLGLATAWLFGIPLVLAAGLYVVLLISPIPLPFISAQVRNLMIASMAPNTELELGEMALALEGYAWPVIQFSPVTYRDKAKGGKVVMEALEVGFSPVRALIGQPGATVTIVAPHIQINQDLFGPRLAEFEIEPGTNGEPDTVRVIEGSSAFPNAGFGKDGISVTGETNELTHVRSDNDWIVLNLEAAQVGIASVIQQAELGRFSRLIIRDGVIDMNDAVYATMRTFTGITLDIAPTPNGKDVEGNFAANFGGAIMQGIFERVLDDQGDARLKISLNNFDLSAFAPIVNDTGSAGGIVGPTAISLDVGFDPGTGKIKDGDFRVDMTGTDVRVNGELIPIASEIMEIDWKPDTGTFTMAESRLNLGGATLDMSGVFVMGYDELYGPIVAISMAAKDIGVPDESGEIVPMFDAASFAGWSAPLYGAVGIDKFIVARADGPRVEGQGRIDSVRKGLGVDMSVTASGFTVADLKRLMPPMAGPGGEARDWLVKNLIAGTVETFSAKVAFPVGTLALSGEPKPLPQNALFIDLVTDGLEIAAIEGMSPIAMHGKTRIQVHDTEVTMAADGGVIQTPNGNISVANAALVMTSETPGESIVEISGDMMGGIPAIAAIAKQFQPEAISQQSMPVDLNSLTGTVSVRMLATAFLDAQGTVGKTDFSINGNVQDFGTSAPIQGHSLTNGQLSFMATQTGFRVGGSAELDGMGADVVIEGDLSTGAEMPPMTISAIASLDDLSSLGFDTSEFAKGKVTVTAKPRPDGAIDIVADLKAASLTIEDIGISKPAGEAALVKATVRQTGDTTDITNLDLAFGSVKLKGSLKVDAKKGLQSAEFSNFALSEGDAAQLSLTPIKDGYAVRIRGSQLDLKPILARSFDLTSGAGGVQATSFTQTIALDVELDRALGMYKTNAFNVNLDLALRGTDVRNVSMQALIGTNGQVSIATNPIDSGRAMTVVFNDLGSILRFVGVYPQLQGGAGSFVLSQNTETKVDTGAVNLKNFAIVDEKNLQVLVQGHPDTRRMLASGAMVFDSAKADFVRRKDRIQIVEAAVAGDRIGGTGEGFIYTDSKQYDIVGTFVPMFGINNAFGKLFGGGDNGMWGITFAVRGPLDKPEFKVNPLSLLAPGMFRGLFEYKAKEAPRVD